MIYTNIQKSVKFRAGIHWGRREDQEIITQKKDPSHLQLEQKSRGMLDPETSSNSRQRPSAATRSWKQLNGADSGATKHLKTQAIF